MSAIAQRRERARKKPMGRNALAIGALVPTAAALLLFASGTASLIFQILWIKQLSLVVGIEVFATTTGVGAFFAGLAIGSLALGRLADAVARPLRFYACLEIGAAVLGVATTYLLAAAPPIFARLETHSEPLAWAMVFALVGLPPFLMGGALPALVRALPARQETIGNLGGRLYAANTAGAVVGALLPPFILIPALGMQGCARAAAAISFAAGGGAILLDWLVAPTEGFVAKERAAPMSRNMLVALILYAAAGGIALGYEIIWSQSIIPLMSTRSFAFAVVLATYLAGLTLGSALSARVIDRIRDPWGLFGLLVAMAGFISLVGIAMLGKWLVDAQTFAEGTILALTRSELAGMCGRFAVAATFVVLPPTLLLGAAFPVVLRLIVDNKRRGSGTGAAIAFNTLGGILGTFVTGFVLIPSLGLVHALGALAIAAAAIGIFALARGGGARRGLRLAMLATGLASATVAIALPRNSLAVLLSGAHSSTIAFYAEDTAGTVAVVEQRTGPNRFRRLYVQGVSNSGDAMPSLRYMRLQALLPLIIHQGDPRSALVIGYGTGITAGHSCASPALANA